jgi:hypothetical protein
VGFILRFTYGIGRRDRKAPTIHSSITAPPVAEAIVARLKPSL